MSVENHHGFVVCAMVGLEDQPVLTPASRVVAADANAISSPTEKKQ
jgi:hypothetical protein